MASMSVPAENAFAAGITCTECGVHADAGRIFCAKCGAALQTPAPLVTDQDHPTSWQDPCLAQEGSILRFVVLTLLFFTVMGGSVFLILFADRPYGIQLTSIVIYTAAVALYTFSRNRNNAQPFLLSCPVVRGQLPRLIRRHLGFIAGLFIAQTTGLRLRSNLPAHWITSSNSDASPFVIILGVLCLCLAIVETLTNRSLLDRAHDKLGGR